MNLTMASVKVRDGEDTVYAHLLERCHVLVGYGPADHQEDSFLDSLGLEYLDELGYQAEMSAREEC